MAASLFVASSSSRRDSNCEPAFGSGSRSLLTVCSVRASSRLLANVAARSRSAASSVVAAASVAFAAARSRSSAVFLSESFASTGDGSSFAIVRCPPSARSRASASRSDAISAVRSASIASISSRHSRCASPTALSTRR